MNDYQNKKTALIAGGTSGLGLSLAILLSKEFNVIITGRNNPEKKELNFFYLDLLSGSLDKDIDNFLGKKGKVDLFVYSAGFYQEGLLDEIDDKGIQSMVQIGISAPAMIIRRILKKQGSLNGFIAITSTSQTRPRLKEPMYTSIKAGFGMLANSLSLDSRIGKVLVAAPGGMDTPFWRGVDRGKMLNPDEVAKEIMGLYEGSFKYKHAFILRDPNRIKVEEIRKE